MNLAFNQIDEPFPSDICGVNTKTLDLRGNNLTGPVPATIGNCANLHELHLGTFWGFPNSGGTLWRPDYG